MPNVTTLHHYQYGEYMGAAAAAGKLWLAWTDSRNWLTENPGDTEYEDLGIGYPCTPPRRRSHVGLGPPEQPDRRRLERLGDRVDHPVPRLPLHDFRRPVHADRDRGRHQPGRRRTAPSYTYHDDTVSGGIAPTTTWSSRDRRRPAPRRTRTRSSAVATGLCLLPRPSRASRA